MSSWIPLSTTNQIIAATASIGLIVYLYYRQSSMAEEIRTLRMQLSMVGGAVSNTEAQTSSGSFSRCVQRGAAAAPTSSGAPGTVSPSPSSPSSPGSQTGGSPEKPTAGVSTQSLFAYEPPFGRGVAQPPDASGQASRSRYNVTQPFSMSYTQDTIDPAVLRQIDELAVQKRQETQQQQT